MINIKVNNKNLQVSEDQYLIDILRDKGLEIPSLCYLKELHPYGSCWICIIESNGRRPLIPACSTKPYEGLEINTDSERINEVRKMNLELLLSNHYADCYAPCTLTCPANIDIQGYLSLHSMGKYDLALDLIREKNPLPMAIGKVCPHPCESKCRRNFTEEPVAINNIKRVLAEKGFGIFADTETPAELKSFNFKKFLENKSNITSYFSPLTQSLLKKEKKYIDKIAIIGSGPSGLSCAYKLLEKGFQVDIFEKESEPGGMLRYGIPSYRLPREHLDLEVALIHSMGADFYFNQKLGKDIILTELKAKYKAVFLAIGAWLGRPMKIPGDDLQNVSQGIDFLISAAKKEKQNLFGNVFVFGGGNTAVDAARTALRCGAEKVTLVYRRSRNEMPAEDEEIIDMQEEGIEILFLHNPIKFIGKNNKLSSIKLIKMVLGEPDKSGRRRPVPVENSEKEYPADFAFCAIGQYPDTAFLKENINLTKWSTIDTNEQLMTNYTGIFAGGDAAGDGPDIAIKAVREGVDAAHYIEKYILKEKELSDFKVPNIKNEFYIQKDDYKKLNKEDFIKIEKKERVQPEKLSVKQRISNTGLIEKTLSDKSAAVESARCLRCGCQDVFECTLKKYAGDYKANKNKFISNAFSFHTEVIDNSHSRILRDKNKCILCGLCIRICNEVINVKAFDYFNRGFNTTVETDFQMPLAEGPCTSCMLCVMHCPTGALTEKINNNNDGPFKTIIEHKEINIKNKTIKIETNKIKDGTFVKINAPIKHNFSDKEYKALGEKCG